MKLFGGIKSNRGTAKAAHTDTGFWGKKWVRVTTIVLAVIGVLVIGATAWWNLNVKLPDEIDIPDHTELPTFDINTSPPTESDEPTPSPRASVRKPGVYTFLLIGQDYEGANTDTLMVGMLDTVNETINIMSIPRDTMVNVKRNTKRINAAYSMGERSGKGNGILQLKSEIKTIIGFVPDFYAVINLKGFVKMVDAMGGVDFYVPQKMYHIADDITIDLQQGQQVLNGKKALQLVRFRGYVGKDDYGRMETQQAFLKAMAKQALSLGSLFKLNEYIDIAQENLVTDLSLTNMLSFAQTAMGYGTDSINFFTLPSEPGNYGKAAYVYIKEAEAIELINQTINPYSRDITSDDLDILILRS